MRLRTVLGAMFRALRTVWLWLGISLVLLLLIDALLNAVLPEPAGLAVIDPAARAPARSAADAFPDHAAAARYFEEFEEARHVGWRSYVYFRRLPFAGSAIHVDAHGFRVTPPPITVPDGGRPLTVWLFGGSVAWGTGVDDAHTLAAALQLQLSRFLGQTVRVQNFAESGYVSQQSLLSFAAALRCDAPPPDLALFLDGANDVYAAVQSGRAGLPQNEQNRAIEFNLSRRTDRVLLAWAARLKGVGKLLKPVLPDIDAAVLGADVARTYLATASQVQALAKARGIPVLLFWQPTLFDKWPLSPDEQAALGASLVLHRDLQQSATAALRDQAAAAAVPVIDLTTQFTPQPAPRYFDFVHVNGEGLADLAATMALHVPGALVAAPSDAAAPTQVSGAVCRDRPVPSP